MVDLKRFSPKEFKIKNKIYFSFTEKVIYGQQKSRLIGFPTINFCLSKQKLIPFDGCYVTYLLIDHKFYFGLTCIKKNYQNQLFCYTYIENFSQNIYHRDIKIYFIFFYRKNVPFETWEKMRFLLIDDLKILSSNKVINHDILKLKF